jgi:hypothetical protein
MIEEEYGLEEYGLVVLKDSIFDLSFLDLLLEVQVVKCQ